MCQLTASRYWYCLSLSIKWIYIDRSPCIVCIIYLYILYIIVDDVELAMVPADWSQFFVFLYLYIYFVYLCICILIFVVNYLYLYSGGCRASYGAS